MFSRWVDPQFDDIEESPNIPPQQPAPEQEENTGQQREESVRLLNEHQSQQVEVQIRQEVVEKHLPLQVEVQVDQVEAPQSSGPAGGDASEPGGGGDGGFSRLP